MNKKTYTVEGYFTGSVEAESEKDAMISFTELDIDSYTISCVVEEED